MRKMYTWRLPMAAIVAIAAVALMAGCDRDGAGALAASSPTQTTPQGSYIAMARGVVDVEGGLITILAAHDGRVESVNVEDGDNVHQGAVLAVLDRRQADIAKGIAQANLAAAAAQARVAKARLAPSKQQAQRLGAAARAGATSGQSADDAKAALALLNAEIAAADAAVEVARQRVAEAALDVDTREIRAPADGRIVKRSVHVGDAISAQAATPLFQLLPDRARIVRAELNESYVDRIKPGMVAEVVRDTEQGAPLRARVLRVGDVFGPSRLTDDPVERAGARDVECVLALDGGNLRIGQRVLVRFPRK